MFRLKLVVLCLICWMKAYSQNSGYVDVTSEVSEYLKKHNNKDITDFLQQLIIKYDKILLPNYPLQINDNGLVLYSNKSIKFQEYSNLTLAPSNKPKYAMLKLENVQNVEIINANLIGDRENHIGNDGEWGMGIDIRGSYDVRITNANISKFWGDGIYISSNKKNNHSKGIVIENSKFYKNRRNGISIISGENINIFNCHFSNMDGTRPMSGIDIEPNNETDVLKRISIHNITTKNSVSGIQIGLQNLASENIQQRVSIDIKDFKSDNDKFGIWIWHLFKTRNNSKIKKIDGLIKISNIQIYNFRDQPFKTFDTNAYSFFPKIIFENVKINPVQKKLSKTKLQQKLNIFDASLDYFEISYP